jgi:hypothetical protein
MFNLADTELCLWTLLEAGTEVDIRGVQVLKCPSQKTSIATFSTTLWIQLGKVLRKAMTVPVLLGQVQEIDK